MKDVRRFEKWHASYELRVASCGMRPCRLPQPADQHGSAQYKFEQMSRSSNLFRRAVQRRVACGLHQNHLFIECHFEVRLDAVAAIERISQTQNARELQDHATVGKFQKLYALFSRPGQCTAMIAHDHRRQLQLPRTRKESL